MDRDICCKQTFTNFGHITSLVHMSDTLSVGKCALIISKFMLVFKSGSSPREDGRLYCIAIS